MVNVDPIFRYKFKDESLIRLALTHRSSSGSNNERLEFLGDSILSVIVSEELMKRFPSAREGQLTKMRSALVNRKKLSQLALEDDIKKFIILGEGEKKSGGWRRVSILANVFEAIIGAIFLDSSYENCRTLVKERFELSFKELEDKPLLKDPKTRLQENSSLGGLVCPLIHWMPYMVKIMLELLSLVAGLNYFHPKLDKVNQKKCGATGSRGRPLSYKLNMKCGFFAIVGRPNVGKSTLLNSMIHEKVSIISRKPNTTRTSVLGVHTAGQHQVVFIDTPGWQKSQFGLLIDI